MMTKSPVSTSERMARRGLRPAAELASDRPHGDRLKYIGGCRCVPCRAANSRYESERLKARRNGDWNGLVSARPARAHLRRLSRQGVGYKTAAAACGVATSVVAKIVSGKKKQIRRRTETKILSVTKDAIADRALVPAARTWWRIQRMLDEGYTKTAIARMLGYKRALQIGKFTVTARTASNVERLWNRMQQ